MKPENIVAKIEKYIDSLPKESKETYDGIMLIKSKHPFESISTLEDNVGDPILNLAIVVDELKTEIKEEEIKNTKGDDTLRRIKKINKYLNSKFILREQLKKAWIENEKMCITNGFTGFMLNEVLEGVEIGDNLAFKMSNVFPDARGYKEQNIDIADVKSQIKLHKAKETGKKSPDKTACLYVIDGHYYNAEYLVDVYEILGGKIIFKQDNNPLHAAILESENGKAVLLPIKPTNKM